MGYQVLAQIAVVAHFAFLAYLILGGFLAWARWGRRTIALHLCVVAWGFSIITVGQDCPLTHLELWARRRAGEPGLPEGFVDTYLTGVIYPEQYLTEVRILVAVVVLSSWLGLVRRMRVRPESRPATAGGARRA